MGRLSLDSEHVLVCYSAIVPEAALCQSFFDAVPKFPSW